MFKEMSEELVATQNVVRCKCQMKRVNFGLNLSYFVELAYSVFEVLFAGLHSFLVEFLGPCLAYCMVFLKNAPKNNDA